MLPELTEELIVISSCELHDSDKFKHFELVPEDLYKTPYVELRAIELNKKYKFKNFIAEDEFDLIRAARLRQQFGIEGQTLESAMAFRDKALMKDYLKDKIDLPFYKSLLSISDLYSFIENHGFPVIVKPRRESASKGIHVIENLEELYNFSKYFWSENLMVETFIKGNMYHVDVLIDNDETIVFSASKYTGGCLTVLNGVQSLISCQIESQDPMFNRLEEYFYKVLRALPSPRTSVYHLEVFHTEEDKLIFCEIASRIGGGYIIDCISAQFSFDLPTNFFRRLLDLPVEKPTLQQTGIHGFMFFPTKKGKLLYLPKEINTDNIIRYHKLGKEGETYQNPEAVHHRVAGVVAKGHSSENLLHKFYTIEHLLDKEIKWG